MCVKQKKKKYNDLSLQLPKLKTMFREAFSTLIKMSMIQQIRLSVSK